MDDILGRLNQRNSYEEAVFRLRLISAYKNEETGYVKRVVESAVEDVLKLVEPLLTLPARKTFQSEIEKLFKEAVNLWLPIQKSRVKISIDNKPDLAWRSYDEYDTAIERNEEHEKYEPFEAEATDALFPRILYGSTVLLEGYALFSDQSTVIAASFEHSKSKSQPVRRRTNSSNYGVTGQGDNSGQRTNSANAATAAGRHGDSSTSPKSSVRSFTDHVNSRKATNS